MNPDSPESAQRIVAEYAALLERESLSNVYPGSIGTLPFPKSTIKQAIRTCVIALEMSGQMTEELRDFLEIAYVSLADYVEDDLVKLMTELREAGETLAAEGRFARDKRESPAWKVLAESSHLAGDVARMIAQEGDSLRLEFREIRH